MSIQKLCIIVMICVVVLTGCSGETENGAPTEEKSWQQIFEENKEKTVLITTYYLNSDRNGIGSGFFIKDDIIVTNYHVIGPSTEGLPVDRITVTLSNETVLEVIGLDDNLKTRDIAFLQIAPQTLGSIVLGEFNSTYVMDELMHIGNPINLQWTANKGSVSAIRQAKEVDGINWIDPDTQIMQHDISCDHGSSGGVILDSDGYAVAILFAGLSTDGEFRFGISINYVVEYLNEISFSPIPVEPTPTYEFVISNLQIPSTAIRGTTVSGSVDFIGDYSLFLNPVMVIALPTNSGGVYSLLCSPPTVSGSQLSFRVPFPESISGTANIRFKIIDFACLAGLDLNSAWNSSPSNDLSQRITVLSNSMRSEEIPSESSLPTLQIFELCGYRT